MDITGEYRIALEREMVWQALNDPEVLRACIPGCETLDRVSDTEFNATVMAKVGPVKARFKTQITLSDLKPPESYTLTGEGKGGAAGFARGSADVSLEPDGSETILRYAARIQPGGKLAQVGSRLIGGTARKLGEQFFSQFAQRLAAPE